MYFPSAYSAPQPQRTTTPIEKVHAIILYAVLCDLDLFITPYIFRPIKRQAFTQALVPGLIMNKIVFAYIVPLVSTETLSKPLYENLPISD
jgi:hypothetical protein